MAQWVGRFQVNIVNSRLNLSIGALDGAGIELDNIRESKINIYLTFRDVILYFKSQEEDGDWSVHCSALGEI